MAEFVDGGRRRRNVYDKKSQRYAKDNYTGFNCLQYKSVAYVTNNKGLCSTFYTIASHGLFATAEPLVYFTWSFIWTLPTYALRYISITLWDDQSMLYLYFTPVCIVVPRCSVFGPWNVNMRYVRCLHLEIATSSSAPRYDVSHTWVCEAVFGLVKHFKSWYLKVFDVFNCRQLIGNYVKIKK